LSARKAAEELNRRGITTAEGGKWAMRPDFRGSQLRRRIWRFFVAMGDAAVLVRRGALNQRRPAKEAPGRQGRINKLTGKVSAVTRTQIQVIFAARGARPPRPGAGCDRVKFNLAHGQQAQRQGSSRRAGRSRRLENLGGGGPARAAWREARHDSRASMATALSLTPQKARIRRP
jgi:hypothetical protein